MRCLILGASGQDGSYLAEQLADAGDEVWGMFRTRAGRYGWAATLVADGRVLPVDGDLLDPASLTRALRLVNPDEIYNLAAVTAPGAGWGHPQPPLIAETTGVGVLNLLEAVRQQTPSARLVHASTSAIYAPHRYGLYGTAKTFAHQAVAGYRDGYQLHASNAVLYSHMSPRQPDTFLGRRVTRTVAQITAGTPIRLPLSDPGHRRSWGSAPDFVRVFPLMARRGQPGDYDVAGSTHTIRHLVATAFKAAGLDWQEHTDVIGPRQPDESPPPGVSAEAIGWQQQAVFADVIAGMVRAEMTP